MWLMRADMCLVDAGDVCRSTA